MLRQLKNSAPLAAGFLAIMVMSGSGVPAYVLLDPERRVFDPPVVITVDERGSPAVDDPDGGVTAAIVSAEEWNTKDRTLVIAQAGDVTTSLHVGDGVSTIHFDDPQNTCSKRLSCLAAAFVTIKRNESGTCGGLELFPITETDIIFNARIPSWDSRYDPGQCGGVSLDAVVTHEVGHALGLGHSNDPRSVMSPFSRVFCSPYPPHQDDWAGIEALYDCGLVRH